MVATFGECCGVYTHYSGETFKQKFSPPHLEGTMHASAYVFDTSAFTNLGMPTHAAMSHIIGSLPPQVQTWIPETARKELVLHLESTRSLAAVHPVVWRRLRVGGTPLASTTVPMSVVRALVDDQRERSHAAIKKAVAAVKKALFEPAVAGVGRVRDEACQGPISALREGMRASLRAGVLDSATDVDVISLALEKCAAVVSADGGLNDFARSLGLETTNPGYLLPRQGGGGGAAPPMPPPGDHGRLRKKPRGYTTE